MKPSEADRALRRLVDGLGTERHVRPPEPPRRWFPSYTRAELVKEIVLTLLLIGTFAFDVWLVAGIIASAK